MAYEDLENLVFRGDPGYVWLKHIQEHDIVEYLGRKKPSEYHPDVIPLICRYPFADEDSVAFVCQQFLKLLVYSDEYLARFKDRLDVVVFISGFFEANGYISAVNQLVYHRNLLLKQGLESDACEVMTLNHAIDHLYARKFSA